MNTVWAIARNTVMQAMRMKAAYFIILLYIAVSAALPFILEADGTQLGEIKVMLTYNLTFSMALLTVLTLLLSTGLLHIEITKRHIFLLASKPISRFKILLGKFSGIMLLNLWLLILMGAITYISCWYMSRLDTSRAIEYKLIREQLLTSRMSYRPPEFDFDRFVNSMKQQMVSQGIKPEDINSRTVREVLKRKVEKNQIRIAPHESLQLGIGNIPVDKDKNQTYTIKYKIYATDGAKSPLRCEWVFFNPEVKSYMVRYSDSRSGETREFNVPSGIVSSKGKVFIKVRNITFGNPRDKRQDFRKPHPISFSMEEGVELLIPGGSFMINLAKSLLMLFLRLSLITIVGVAAGAYLHFPVAALLLLTLTMYGYGRTFIDVQLDRSLNTNKERSKQQVSSQTEPDPLFKTLRRRFFYPVIRTAIRVSPDFTQSDPTKDLIAGRAISWAKILKLFFWDIVLRGGLALLIGIYLIYKRELALPEN
ncbi:MAG: hypothetical protein ACYTFY_08225 [Planctomycetota bacterium]|jgi:hypothetical protein